MQLHAADAAYVRAPTDAASEGAVGSIRCCLGIKAARLQLVLIEAALLQLICLEAASMQLHAADAAAAGSHLHTFRSTFRVVDAVVAIVVVDVAVDA